MSENNNGKNSNPKAFDLLNKILTLLLIINIACILVTGQSDKRLSFSMIIICGILAMRYILLSKK